jgi:hypothetical protein
MAGTIFLYLSRRSQRIVAAVLSLVLIHMLTAGGTSEPISSEAHIEVKR